MGIAHSTEPYTHSAAYPHGRRLVLTRGDIFLVFGCYELLPFCYTRSWCPADNTSFGFSQWLCVVVMSSRNKVARWGNLMASIDTLYTTPTLHSELN